MIDDDDEMCISKESILVILDEYSRVSRDRACPEHERSRRSPLLQIAVYTHGHRRRSAKQKQSHSLALHDAVLLNKIVQQTCCVVILYFHNI